MKSPPSSHKVQQAIAFIRENIASGRFPPGSALPPIRQLTAGAGVSYVTLWKAVRALHDQGVLSAIPGQCTMVQGGATPVSGRSPIPEPAGVVPQRSALRIKERIERDIGEGLYEPGARLPLLKQLRSRYGAAYRTVSEALRLLCQERVIRAYGRRGYEVPRLSAAGSRTAICFLVDKRYIEHYAAGIIQGHDYLHPVEFEGAKHSLKVLVGECGYEDSQLVPIDLSSVFPSAKGSSYEILGYVFRMNEPDGNLRLLNMLKQQSKPVSILDERGMWDYSEIPGNSPLFRVFPIGVNELPGRVVGRYLLGLGHRKIAYISPYQQVRWSQSRLAGLREVLRNAGRGCVLTEVIMDSTTSLHQEIGKPHVVVRVLDGRAGTVRSTGSTSADPGQTEVLDDARKVSDLFHGQVRGLFDEALRDPDITAWATANDSVAVDACEYLKNHRVRVPEQISVVSFDDSHAAIAYKITSYNFNIHSIVNAALRHIIDFPSRPKPGGVKCTEVEGVIVERETTARRLGPAQMG